MPGRRCCCSRCSWRAVLSQPVSEQTGASRVLVLWGLGEVGGLSTIDVLWGAGWGTGVWGRWLLGSTPYHLVLGGWWGDLPGEEGVAG